MDVAFDQRDALRRGAGLERVVQFGAGGLDLVGVAALGAGIVALGVCTGGQDHVEQAGLVGIGTGRTDADDVLDAVLGVQLIGIDADGRHAHAAAHHADGAALVSTRIAKHTAHIGDEARIFKKGLRNEFGAQGVPRHQDGFGKIAVFGAVMRGRHFGTLLYFRFVPYSIPHLPHLW